jgi:hypothetical protein
VRGRVEIPVGLVIIGILARIFLVVDFITVIIIEHWHEIEDCARQGNGWKGQATAIESPLEAPGTGGTPVSRTIVPNRISRGAAATTLAISRFR